jgi:hypothetical protein
MSKPMKEERLREIEDGLDEGKKNHTLDYYPPRTVNELVREIRRLQNRRYWWLTLPIALGLFIGQGVWFLFTH